MDTSLPTCRIILQPKRARPFFGRHPWVYPGAIGRIEGEPKDGDVVELQSHAGNFIARGLYNGQSKIRVRLFSWEAEQPLDEAFFRARLSAAIRLRREMLELGGPGQACRFVSSEADGLPGLTVDQYDRWLVVQFTSLGLAQRRDLLADLLEELVRPAGIYVRTERGIGQLEGLELQDGLVRVMPVEPAIIKENGVRFRVDFAEGQKTGFFLDQRDNRAAAARLAKGRRVLDAFCYSGGFGLHAAKAGASSVLGLDVSEPALELARANATLNGLTQLTFERGDVFDRMAELATAGEKFGMIVLDPPKFARSGGAVEEALRGYRRLLELGLRLLESDGVLVLCCCTGLIRRDMLVELLAQAAADDKRLLQILESRGPSPDHPVAATCPEGDYLKCLICRVV